MCCYKWHLEEKKNLSGVRPPWRTRIWILLWWRQKKHPLSFPLICFFFGLGFLKWMLIDIFKRAFLYDYSMCLMKALTFCYNTFLRLVMIKRRAWKKDTNGLQLGGDWSSNHPVHHCKQHTFVFLPHCMPQELLKHMCFETTFTTI